MKNAAVEQSHVSEQANARLRPVRYYPVNGDQYDGLLKSVGTLEARVNEDLGVIAGQLNAAFQRFSLCSQTNHGQGAGLECAGCRTGVTG
ncbi:hypothetical protein AWJ19_23545 [Paenibacillus sp. DMB5]|nr:hypothetical protein AWJ19_23545 [Paenibacillus sp. DMB5]